MRRNPTLNRNLFAALAASLLWTPAAHASGDDGCYVPNTLRQTSYSCGNVPMLTPANDTRINAMLMMVDSAKVAQVFPDPKTIPAKDRINQIVVPFPMDFSGWIYIGQKEPDKSGGAAEADASSNRYADGEGSICRSMSAGADAFNAALGGAGGLPADEAARLRAARAPRGRSRRSSRRSASSSPRTSTARTRSTAPTSSPRPGPSRTHRTARTRG